MLIRLRAIRGRMSWVLASPPFMYDPPSLTFKEMGTGHPIWTWNLSENLHLRRNFGNYLYRLSNDISTLHFPEIIYFDICFHFFPYILLVNFPFPASIFHRSVKSRKQELIDASEKLKLCKNQGFSKLNQKKLSMISDENNSGNASKLDEYIVNQAARHFRNLVQLSNKPGESPKIPKDCSRIPQNPEKPHDFHFAKSSRIHWNPQESLGIPRNSQESPRILKNPKIFRISPPILFETLYKIFKVSSPS